MKIRQGARQSGRTSSARGQCTAGKLFALTAIVLGAVTWTCAPTSAEPLPQPPPGGSLGLALGVPTVPNLRDLGGYRTRDGGEVARGLVYRSDAFIGMSAEDVKKIEPLGLKNDYDLRLTAEAKAAPDELPQMSAITC
jgi:hypothetical protein